MKTMVEARIRPVAVVAGAATLLSLGLVQTGPASGQEASPAAQVGARLLEPEVGLIEAQEIALEGQADAAVREVALEREGDEFAWEVTLDTGVEVEIDATTGEILETEQADDDDEAEDDANGEDDAEGEDVSITGPAIEQASAGALEFLGEGRVTDTEVGDEEGYYEVEVTLDNGSPVDVHLDEEFNVLGQEADGAEEDDQE